MRVIAARSRPSLVPAGRPVSGRPMVYGTPIWLPSGVQHRHREVPGVHVHCDDVALPGLRQRDGLGHWRLP